MNKIFGKFGVWVNFLKNVGKEAKHLKFPTRAETLIYLIIVLVLALFCSIMFFIIDKFAYSIVSKILFFFS